MRITKLTINVLERIVKHLKKSLEVKPKLDKSIFKVSKEDIDMGGLMDNINKSRELYKVLSRKYHPDRFIGTNKHARAGVLMQEITENKRKYNKLLKLQKIAENEL